MKTFFELILPVNLAKHRFPTAIESISREIIFPAAAFVKSNESVMPSILNAMPRDAAKQQIRTIASEATSLRDRSVMSQIDSVFFQELFLLEMVFNAFI